jgi:hypothetical protein
MKKIIILITAILPIIILSVASTTIFSMIFGESVTQYIPIIAFSITFLTLLISLIVVLRKRKRAKK